LLKRCISFALGGNTSHENPQRLTKVEKKSGLEEMYSAKTLRETFAEAQSTDARMPSRSLNAAYQTGEWTTYPP
jgi:hypothetical protein